MTIEKIVTDVLRKIGREDIAADIEDGGEPGGESGEVVKTVLYCINATEDELARYYFPLPFAEKFATEDGFCAFTSFTRTPVKILKITKGGKEIPFEVSQDGILTAAGEIEIKYYYTPARKTISDDSEFSCLGDGNITSLGAAAEYCLIIGEASMAEVWEERYRSAIDRARSQITKGAYIPPRRWI